MAKRVLIEITRVNEMLRPMRYDRREVKNIVIFNHEGEILFTLNRGWFEVRTKSNTSYIFTKDIKSFTISNPIRCNSLNFSLTRKDKANLWYNNTLYIHSSEVSVENARDEIAFESKLEKQYLRIADLTFAHGYNLGEGVMFDSVECAQGYYVKTEKTELGTEVEKYQKEFEILGIKIQSRYEMQILLDNYDIKRK